VFVGHIAVGFAAKPAAPKTSLGTLVLAAVLPDFTRSAGIRGVRYSSSPPS
jgi:hypothetical protein